MSKAIITVVLIIFISGCESKSQKQIKSVDQANFSLKAEVVELSDNSNIFRPVRILNHNDQYLIISERLNEDYIKVWSLPDLEFLYSWGKLGGGPYEFLNTPMYFQSAEDELLVHDVLSRRVRNYEVTPSSIVLTKSTSLSYEDQIDPLSNPLMMSDGHFVADYGTGMEQTDNEHVIIQPGYDQPLTFFGKYPDTELQAFDRYFEFSKTGITNPKNGMFASFYNNYNRFKIYDSSGTLLKDIEVNDTELSKLDDHNSGDYRYFLYRNPVWASDEYIYCIGFYGFSDVLFEKPDSSTTTSFEIWDWDGNAVYKTTFDRYIRNFTVSEAHNKVYGYGFNVEDSLFVYDLPELK
jgi:hypothetical protein